MKEYLFVGGPKDGERIKTDGTEVMFRQIEDVRKNFCSTLDPAVVREEAIHRYKPLRFRGDREDFIIYCWNNLSPDGLVRLLIHEYQRPKLKREETGNEYLTRAFGHRPELHADSEE